MKEREHHTVIAYKNNYEDIKRALDKFSSHLVEFLAYENKGISERGLRQLFANVGEMRRVIYTKGQQNRDIFFRVCNTVDNQFKNFKKMSKKKYNVS